MSVHICTSAGVITALSSDGALSIGTPFLTPVLGTLGRISVDDNDAFSWMKDSLCAEFGPELFDLYEKDRAAAEQVDEMCLNCPVIAKCFVAGSNNNWGQWGGVFWNGSGRPEYKANSHKTEEYLQEVEQLVSITLQ